MRFGTAVFTGVAAVLEIDQGDLGILPTPVGDDAGSKAIVRAEPRLRDEEPQVGQRYRP